MKRTRTYYNRNQERFDFGTPETFAEKQAREGRERAEQHRQSRERWEATGRAERERQYRRQAWSAFVNQAGAESAHVTLNVAREATQAEIRSAWIKLVQIHHPDHGGDATMFRKVQKAYECLRQAA